MKTRTLFFALFLSFITMTSFAQRFLIFSAACEESERRARAEREQKDRDYDEYLKRQKKENIQVNNSDLSERYSWIHDYDEYLKRQKKENIQVNNSDLSERYSWIHESRPVKKVLSPEEKEKIRLNQLFAENKKIWKEISQPRFSVLSFIRKKNNALVHTIFDSKSVLLDANGKEITEELKVKSWKDIQDELKKEGKETEDAMRNAGINKGALFIKMSVNHALLLIQLAEIDEIHSENSSGEFRREIEEKIKEIRNTLKEKRVEAEKQIKTTWEEKVEKSGYEFFYSY